MPFSDYEIDIDEELLQSAREYSGLSDISDVVNFALNEMLERLRLDRNGTNE